MSERRLKKEIYDRINASALPGDIIFIITTGFAISATQKVWRGWLGLSKNDTSKWHTTLVTGSKTEPRGSTVRPYIIHSGEKGFRQAGTIEEHILPGYYTSTSALDTVIEVVRMRQLTDAQRNIIVAYAKGKLGLPHDPRGWTKELWTY